MRAIQNQSFFRFVSLGTQKTPSAVQSLLYFFTLARNNNDNLILESATRKTCEKTT